MKIKNLLIAIGIMILLFGAASTLITSLLSPNITDKLPDATDTPSDETTIGDISDETTPENVPDETTPGNVPDDIGSYKINWNLVNAVVEEVKQSINEEDRLIITVTAKDGYFVPRAITVTGADYMWDVFDENCGTGILELYNPTEDVNVTINASNELKVNYTVVNNTGYDSPYYDIEYIAPSLVPGYTELFLCVTTNGCKIGSVESNTGYAILTSTEGSKHAYAFDWGGAYPSGGVIDITIILTN